MNPYRDIPRRTLFFESVLDRVRALPGVTSVAATTELPFDPGKVPQNFVIEGEPPVEPGREPDVMSRGVSTTYLRTLGIPLRRGRDLEPTDTASSEPVGIVNEAAARTLFHGSDPIGRRVAWARAEPRVWIRVVGVAGDVRGDGLDADDTPALYTPMAQEPRPWRTWMNVVVRSSVAPAALTESIKREVGRVDKDVPVTRVRAMNELAAGLVRGPPLHARAAGRLRGGGRGPGRGRDLRRHGLRRLAPHPRDRPAHGAGGARGGRDAPRPGPDHGRDPPRHRRGPGRRPRLAAHRREHALRRGPGRPGHAARWWP